LGKAEKPDLIIDTPFKVWVDILTDKAEAQQMLTEKKYRAEGDLSLLTRMEKLL